ncbi:hypothetical protein CYLTODRAFT_493213 [Cylindrobasidium torrendii FP15055 ss-10]|uniref:F-box domain-containing protein n=1 Tax=Cylindrobasidium torrendii FP15055 ss-10 TaxID=1314674 RepID=A0A0D7B118_9AGAR|nr:hypothetical protein CYLTODRAFT_493213 [Cylindrobasidium torrendii FP15055 ss-10]
MTITLLELDDDVLSIMCIWVQRIPLPPKSSEHTPWRMTGKRVNAIQALSCACRKLRAICAPLLFERIEFAWDNNFDGRDFDEVYGALRRGWGSSISLHARSLRIALLFHDLPNALGLSLARFLSGIVLGLPRLVRLEISCLRDYSSQYELGQYIRSLDLPKIRELVISLDHWQLIPACPNVQSVEVADNHYFENKEEMYVKLLNAVAKSTQLQSFACPVVGSPQTVAATLDHVQKALPYLQVLVLKEAGCYYEAVLPNLQGFKRLEILVLPSLVKIGIGYREPQNRNAFSGRHADELRWRIHARKKETIEKLAQETFKACKELQTLWVGSDIKIRKMAGTDELQYDFNAVATHTSVSWKY